MTVCRLYFCLFLLSIIFTGCAKVCYQKIGTDYYHIVCNHRMSACKNKAVELCGTTEYEPILTDTFKRKRVLIIKGRKFFTSKRNHEMKVLCRSKQKKKPSAYR